MTPKRTARSLVRSGDTIKKQRKSKTTLSNFQNTSSDIIDDAHTERTPSTNIHQHSGGGDEATSSGDEGAHETEPRPTHTSEIGTLRKLSGHNGTAWLGSSSGVYFVNTVRRAFSTAFVLSEKTSTEQINGRAEGENAGGQTVPPSEDILTGDHDDGRNYNGPMSASRPPTIEHPVDFIARALGRVPTDRNLAMQLITTYFRSWHPLFPFLHGPRFLKDMDDIYAHYFSDSGKSKELAPAQEDSELSTNPALSIKKLVTFQIVLNLASLDRPDLDLPSDSRIKSAPDVTRVAGLLAIHHDTETIQACLAAELYLVATICLRQASTVAGVVLKLIFHAGLHRCPLRYAQLKQEDCEIRKRIFWSAYALDRYLSLSLGDPITVQDSDIDVCLSGKELHKAVPPEQITTHTDEIKAHLQIRVAPSVNFAPRSDVERAISSQHGHQTQEKQLREAAMAAYVHYGRLTGRIIELFHKSIHARFPKHDAIVYLESDVEDWWNQLPTALTTEDPASNTQYTPEDITLHHKQLAPFFTILNQQLHLLLNRPKLSLDQSSADFQHGLQICIKASRTTLFALKKHVDGGQSMLLPGLFSATWMAGLIIAFACQLGKYPKHRACSEISTCLQILESRKWFTVRNCHKVLSLLLANIKSRRATTGGVLSTNRPGIPAEPSVVGPETRAGKTNRDFARILNPLPQRANRGQDQQPVSGVEARERQRYASEDFRSAEAASLRVSEAQSSNVMQNLTRSADTQGTPSDVSIESSEGLNIISGSPAGERPNLSGNFGSALYTDPQDAEWAEMNHNISLQPSGTANTETDDAMFWDNLDYSMPDIFGAASWEQMIGVGGPGRNATLDPFWLDWNPAVQ